VLVAAGALGALAALGGRRLLVTLLFVAVLP